MTKGTNKAAGPKTVQPGAAGQTPRTHSSELGDIVWLMTCDPVHKLLRLKDLEWFAMPSILLTQYRIFRVKDKPIGVAFWAWLSSEAEARLLAADGERRLDPKDWKSGDRLWLVALVAPFGHAEVMLADLKKTVFAGKPFKFHRRDPGGTEEVVTVADDSTGSAPDVSTHRD